MESLLTVKELSKVLNCSPKSIYRMVQDDVIPYYDLRSGYRFDLDKVLKAIEHNPLDEEESSEE